MCAVMCGKWSILFFRTQNAAIAATLTGTQRALADTSPGPSALRKQMVLSQLLAITPETLSPTLGVKFEQLALLQIVCVALLLGFQKFLDFRFA